MFRELYYWMYSHLKTIKTNDTPAFNAYLLISVLQGFNIGTVYVIIAQLVKRSTATDRNTAIYMGLGLAAVLFIMNYFILYAKRINIFDKCEALPPNRRAKGKIFFWLYVVLSLVVFFVSIANFVESKY